MDAVRLRDRCLRLSGGVRPLLDGDEPPATYLLTRWVFLRLLGVVYFIAFASLEAQLIGLVGERGLLPAGEYLEQVGEHYGPKCYQRCPTICWISADDAMLKTLCWGGAALSVLLTAGVAPLLVLVLLWISYLSLVSVGQPFLSFQWDALLLETGLLAVFYAPEKWLPGLAREGRPSAVARWLLWWLLFRLMFLSGVTKILSDDPTWLCGTALHYHFETQPIPTWIGWYAHYIPDWIKRFSVGEMFFIEIVVPFLIFVPPRFRQQRYVACVLLIALQFGIAVTGNYGFFNLLTVVLCLLLLDDGAWQRILPRRWRMSAERIRQRPPSPIAHRVIVAGAAFVMVPLSLLTVSYEMERTKAQAARVVREARWTDAVLVWIQPFHSVNGYGLFRVMTTRRIEIVIETSEDGFIWQEYEFRWKPGDVTRAPPFVAPYMPRLDWHMWFAALEAPGLLQWVHSLVQRLAEGEPAVLRLLDEKTAPSIPPRYFRLALYDYRFSTPDVRRRDGVWWERKRLGNMTPPLQLTERP